MSRFLLPLLLLAACDSTWSAADDGDGDGWTADYDCDDADPGVFPNADEACDGVDQDCDGEIDESAPDAPRWYADADADGYGDLAAPVAACDAPEGYVADATDCDDADAAFHPGADEADCADPNDYDCDGSVGFADADGDGFPACEDCDDTDAAVSPSATETCDGVDDDCDGDTDEDAADAIAWYDDADGDGYGAGQETLACVAPDGAVADATDCDDALATVNPAAGETCDGLDDDCDGDTDEADAADVAAWYADADGDGFGAGPATWACTAPAGFVAGDTDCDDTLAAVNPAATEVCDGGLDDDCDGLADDHDTGLDGSTATAWALDYDGDGYGDAAYAYTGCAARSGYVADATDCDDDDAAVSPAATEICDDADDDCDGLVDDADASLDLGTASGWYDDLDVDGYGAGDVTDACDQPAGKVADGSDCDDADASVSPAATEVCDTVGHDEDCDGVATAPGTVYADVDGDGYGDETDAGTVACEAAGLVGNADDCDDADAAINPGATELCDETDSNCDGVEFFQSDFTSDVSSSILSVNGDAYVDTTNGMLVLTDATGDQHGGASIVQVVPTGGWYASMDFEISGGMGTGGADGMTFYFLDASTSPAAYSRAGGGSGLSVYGLDGYAVEVDTYVGAFDTLEDPHVALIDTSDMSEVAAVAIDDPRDGNVHTLGLAFAAGYVDVSLDGTAILSASIPDYVATETLLGVSGSTGGAYEEHAVDALEVDCE